MDAEKDKPLPEKSPSFASRDISKSDPKKDDDDDNNNININDENINNNDASPKKPDPDKEDLPQDNVAEIQSVVEPPSDVEPTSEITDAIDVQSETKEEEKPAVEIEVEEPCPLPPDLHKVSEEIDQYISALFAAKRDDESTPPDVPISVEQFAVLVEAKIDELDSGDTPVKWSLLTEEDSVSFLEAVNRVSSLSRALSEFSTEYKYAYSINRIGGVHQRAMSYLEEEFKSFLDDYKIHDADSALDAKPRQSVSSNSSNQDPPEQNPPPESPAEESHFPRYSDEILSNLIRLSKALMAGGYETECCQVYFVARRSALEASLHKLGFEKHSIDDVQKMHWDSLEREIVAWIKTFKQFATVQFSCERKLTDAVFADHPSISERLFGSLSYGVTIQLLNFAEAIALTKRAAEKLFKFLDIYEALRDTLPAIEDSFSQEWVNELKTEASMIRCRLGEAMISIFMELENSIKADSGKTPVPGGAVHPLTKYITNYITFAGEYKDTLEQVFREHQKIERADSATGSEYDYNSQAQSVPNNNTVKQSPLQTQIVKVMDLLDSNLESKSKLYRDTSLSSIFMMNNGRYILQKIRGCSEISSLMGDTWYRKRSSDLRQYHKGYQRETWGKLLSCLHPEGLTVHGKVVKPQLKERFKSFNAMFDEIHKTQSTWVVGDEQLQSELRVSISNMVIPAYRSFLGRFSQVFTPGRQTEKYVKYQPEDIETYIDELFDGNAAPVGRRKL